MTAIIYIDIFQNKITVYRKTTIELKISTSFGFLFAKFHNMSTQMIAPHILMIRKLLSAARVLRNGFP